MKQPAYPKHTPLPGVRQLLRCVFALTVSVNCEDLPQQSYQLATSTFDQQDSIEVSDTQRESFSSLRKKVFLETFDLASAASKSD